MNKMRDRVKTQFPMVLLTLVSIIQALALELLWGKVTESDYLFQSGMSAVIGWGMVSVTLMGILQVWVMYSTLVVGFTWRAGIRDSIFPFVLGIQEFVLVAMIQDPFEPLWLFALASIFVVGNWIAHMSYRRARVDESNSAFFRGRPPATLRDFRGPISFIVLFVGLGMSIVWLGNPGWLIMVAIVIANAVLLAQIYVSRRLWRSVMDLEE